MLVILAVLAWTAPHGEVSTGKFFPNEYNRGGWAYFQVGARVLQFKGFGLVLGGWTQVWTKRGQGVIQFAPWRSDYCGYAGVSWQDWQFALEHTCFHSVDTFVERSLYWNCLRLSWQHDKGPLWARLSGAFYINDKDQYWLSKGADYANDITVDAEFQPVKPLFVRFWNFTGIGLNYRRFHIGTELDAGVAWVEENRTRLRFFVGVRPYDHKEHRNVQAWLAGLRYSFDFR